MEPYISDNTRRDNDRGWRKSEFVVSYPPKGNYVTGTLHRSSCHTLSVEQRQYSQEPNDVYETTLEKFRKGADAYGHGGKVKVCQKCCKDIVVQGHRVEGPKPEKVHSFHISLTKTEAEDLQKALDSYLTLSGGDDDDRCAVATKIRDSLKAACKGLPRR